MNQSKLYLFTSPTCPHCHSARALMEKFKKEREDYIFKELSTATSEGQKQAQKFGIMSVPTFIIKGPGYPEPIGLRGLQSKESLNKYLDLSYGIKEKKVERRGFKIGKFKIKKEESVAAGVRRIKAVVD